MEVDQLKQQLAALQQALQQEHDKAADAKQDSEEAKAELKKTEEKLKELTKTGGTKPIYLAPGRRLEVFKGKAVKVSDPSIYDWVADVRAQLELRSLTNTEAAAFIKEHLSGDARKEIGGRGDTISSKPEEILQILVRVFGDGDNLPQLQQRFFSYRQEPNQDLLSCSLAIVHLYDRMSCLDESYKASRQISLKGQLAEAVHDENLRRELRRLNIESPSLSYFDFRDRAVKWLGKSPKKTKDVSLNETSTGEDSVLALLKKQAEQLDAQQKQIDKLQTMLQTRRERRCFRCNQVGHFKAICPKKSSETRRDQQQRPLNA
ncbi:uncharacterized protein [Amphiura filiformis]|uniref:uncharacterized protein n=1 Tax=Amphiura filiformis TaxID=82378 RepID=UPI003B21C6F3